MKKRLDFWMHIFHRLQQCQGPSSSKSKLNPIAFKTRVRYTTPILLILYLYIYIYIYMMAHPRKKSDDAHHDNLLRKKATNCVRYCNLLSLT